MLFRSKKNKDTDAAKAKPEADKYIEVGQGQAATVTIANEKNAYCLVDRSTYLSLRKRLRLKIVCEGDESLLNRYSLILVNPDKFPFVNITGARSFFDFLLTKQVRDIVVEFGKEKYGSQNP